MKKRCRCSWSHLECITQYNQHLYGVNYIGWCRLCKRRPDLGDLDPPQKPKKRKGNECDTDELVIFSFLLPVFYCILMCYITN